MPLSTERKERLKESAQSTSTDQLAAGCGICLREEDQGRRGVHGASPGLKLLEVCQAVGIGVGATIVFNNVGGSIEVGVETAVGEQRIEAMCEFPRVGHAVTIGVKALSAGVYREGSRTCRGVLPRIGKLKTINNQKEATE
jgi:hypothetical protein